ncbi:antibiotic biosynthesis monooxygenase family protein [Maridesulfovibrio zosterae]|uniref:antibiotic biosynthesis monooxygenase family protein n=1 Tax=Maridesulfovibrio zosterae TaxID=82171 RepID=UPI0004225E98|nr:antibiotic biosynthesis monooxygenase [Maridesulfovibrio zosterae]
MFAVIFEVTPKAEGKAEYIKIAGQIRSFLESREGFISIERFQSLADERKMLSLSFWENESAIEKWRNLLEHRNAQQAGKDKLFESYRIRVAEVVRDYTEESRKQTPADSVAALS